MKNRQELQEGILRLEADLAELKKQLANKDWEPKGGEWYVTLNGSIDSEASTEQTRIFGIEFETRQAAKKASIDYRKSNRLYKLAEELNNGWSPDWKDQHQKKYRIDYDHRRGKLFVCIDVNQETFAGVYFKCHELALKAAEILDDE